MQDSADAPGRIPFYRSRRITEEILIITFNFVARIYCKLFSFYLSPGQHATHFDGETETMNTALMQLFGRIGSFEKAVIFSDSSAAIQSIAKLDALPSKG
jgi:hypothetical protein